MTGHDSLASLHTAIVDACSGYEEAIERTEKSDVRAILSRVKALHEEAHGELHAALLARGLHPDDNGSFMATVHKAVISVRSTFSGLEGSLSSFASGEERIAEDYDKAIGENRSDGALVALLGRQKTKLETEIGRMKAIAESGQD